jgi:hypothetical protein
LCSQQKREQKKRRNVSLFHLIFSCVALQRNWSCEQISVTCACALGPIFRSFSFKRQKAHTHTHTHQNTLRYFFSAVLMPAKGQPAVEKMRWRGRIFCLLRSACRAVIVVGPRTQNLGPRAAVRLSFVLWRRTLLLRMALVGSTCRSQTLNCRQMRLPTATQADNARAAALSALLRRHNFYRGCISSLASCPLCFYGAQSSAG